jgi:hypothetical protein
MSHHAFVLLAQHMLYQMPGQIIAFMDLSMQILQSATENPDALRILPAAERIC